MLQNATKAITSAFSGSFIKKLSQYLHDCVREEVKSSTFRNLKGDKDNKWWVVPGKEELFTNFDASLMLDGSDSLLTELMLQGEMSQKEKYLIYGYLFLTGKSSSRGKNNDFLTPLLYAPCALKREGMKISCTLQEEVLSLNTGALAQLMKREDEAEVDAMFAGLLDVVPELPLTQEGLDIFLTTLHSLVPELKDDEDCNKAAESFYSENYDEVFKEGDEDFGFDSIDEMSKMPKIKVEKLVLDRTQAVILTKRPTVTAGVLHELTQIGEKSSGVIRENTLNVINQEYLASSGKISQKIKEGAGEFKDFFPITPLSLSDSQEEVIKKIEEHDFLAVYGPPGTGKSQTIVNLVSHLIAKEKSVLVVSRMDKAIDVVAERLNELNAPYLALRCGRANYQKQLNFQLQDLLSNKVDLDFGFEDAVLVDVKDMESLLGEIKRLEESVNKIIKFEESYSELEVEEAESKLAIGELRFVQKRLKLGEIHTVRKALKDVSAKLDEIGRQLNFFEKIKLNWDLGKIKKMLGLKNVDSDDMLARLGVELDCEELTAKLLDTENKIYKIGNLQQILKKIATLKAKQKNLAVEILKNKRRKALKDLLCDQSKRQRLIVHSRSLVSKKQHLQNRLLEKEDFKPLLAAFPCWCATTYAISNSIPLKSGMFDVVIIDEASQCDIASCFPVLYRAKKAVIVGDDKQLPHLSFLEKAKEQSFLNQYGIEDKYQLMWRFRTNSMFDLANYYSTSPVLLDEHFRSTKPIIEFSSSEFYGGRIKIMKPYLSCGGAIEVVTVQNAKVDYDATRNHVEAEALIAKLRDIIAADQGEKSVSIGIVSPFRAQVDLIKRDILRHFDGETILKHQIEVGTAHTFQGDERDIMLASWAIAPNSKFQSLMFLQKPNLFNVAITRARKKIINFVSRDVSDLPVGLLRDYLEYARAYGLETQTNTFKNEFEKEVYREINKVLFEKGGDFKVYAGVEAGGVMADIVIETGAKRIAIECDGEKDDAPSRTNPAKKQAILERCGFSVLRVVKREWNLSKQVPLDRILACI